jgi:hypothetical protein
MVGGGLGRIAVPRLSVPDPEFARPSLPEMVAKDGPSAACSKRCAGERS